MATGKREAAMLGDVRNLKTSDIELRQRLPALECEWLVGQLRARPGIAAVRCAGDARRVTVEYDADKLVSSDVVDFLSQCGVRVTAVRPADFRSRIVDADEHARNIDKA